jgi:hypothetical protein
LAQKPQQHIHENLFACVLHSTGHFQSFRLLRDVLWPTVTI